MKRLRLTVSLPLDGTYIGPTLWIGSVERGWTGYPLFQRGMRWSIKGVKP